MERRVLVLGGGGREHALATALARSPSVSEVLVAPGNAGTRSEARRGHARVRNLTVGALLPADVSDLARREHVDLVVVGPEAPLCDGVVDALGDVGIAAFGPSAAAARLEGSKAFMKRFATRHGIPTASYLITSNIEDAERYIDARGCPQVVKADGLCAGKGAIVTDDAAAAKSAARRFLVDGEVGPAGRTIVIEDRLVGVEMSVHAITDGERFFVLPVARDHKRVADGDRGPNTGGMGAFAPVQADAHLMDRVERMVLEPTLRGMRDEGAPYRGVLYAGLIIGADSTPGSSPKGSSLSPGSSPKGSSAFPGSSPEGSSAFPGSSPEGSSAFPGSSPEGSSRVPYLLEHNVRFGDPETQVLMPLLDGDVAELLWSAAKGKLDARSVHVAMARHAVVVVVAAHGYPASPRKGDAVRGIDDAARVDGVTVYHAGTAQADGETLVTAGGRVLGVGAVGESVRQARERAYLAVERIDFAGMHYRRDIAAGGT